MDSAERLDFPDADAALLAKGEAPQTNDDGESALRLCVPPLLSSLGSLLFLVFREKNGV